ncbi:MAG: CD225/dispanin family protein [Rhodococcus sp. (in: high G+C Gram-positive bacteria)]
MTDQPQYPGPGYPQQNYGPPPLPPTNAGWAAAALIFFWPLAFSAFNHSSSVFPRWSLGDYQGAQYASDRTKELGKYALYIFGGLFVLFILFYVVIIAFAIAAGSSFDSSY